MCTRINKMLHRNSAQRLGQSFLSLYGGSGLQVSRCDKAHTRVLERSCAAAPKGGDLEKLTTWLSTYLLSTFCGEGFKAGSAAETHTNHHTHFTVRRTPAQRFWARALSATIRQAWLLELGAEGIPEAEEGVGQYPNKVLKISFRRPQSS